MLKFYKCNGTVMTLTSITVIFTTCTLTPNGKPYHRNPEGLTTPPKVTSVSGTGCGFITISVNTWASGFYKYISAVNNKLMMIEEIDNL